MFGVGDVRDKVFSIIKCTVNYYRQVSFIEPNFQRYTAINKNFTRLNKNYNRRDIF